MPSRRQVENRPVLRDSQPRAWFRTRRRSSCTTRRSRRQRRRRRRRDAREAPDTRQHRMKTWKVIPFVELDRPRRLNSENCNSGGRFHKILRMCTLQLLVFGKAVLKFELRELHLEHRVSSKNITDNTTGKIAKINRSLMRATKGCF